MCCDCANQCYSTWLRQSLDLRSAYISGIVRCRSVQYLQWGMGTLNNWLHDYVAHFIVVAIMVIVWHIFVAVLIRDSFFHCFLFNCMLSSCKLRWRTWRLRFSWPNLEIFLPMECRCIECKEMLSIKGQLRSGQNARVCSDQITRKLRFHLQYHWNIRNNWVQ